MPVIARYALATVGPWLLIVLAALVAGPLPALALLALTALVFGLDQLLSPPEASREHALWAMRLSAGLAIAHLALIPVVLAGLGAPRMGIGEGLFLILATASFMGQVSHANAHDLSHRRARWLRWLGAAVYTSMLYGHHVSAHRYVHHARVGTTDDPATPLPGEAFWAYVARAWPENALAGFEAEAARLERLGRPIWSWRNPYWAWGLGGLATLVFVVWSSGAGGLLAYLVIAALFHLQVLQSDYVQHYGLQRLRLPGGRFEPVGAHHSWDAPSGFSTLLMLNAPRHAEHHANPGRPFHDLGNPVAEGPRLPYPMPVMASIALVPPVWHQMMDRRALKVMEASAKRLGLDRDAPTAPGDLRRALLAG